MWLLKSLGTIIRLILHGLGGLFKFNKKAQDEMLDRIKDEHDRR